MERPTAERGISDTPTLVGEEVAPTNVWAPAGHDSDNDIARCKCPSDHVSRNCVCKVQQDKALKTWMETAEKSAKEGWTECSRRLQEHDQQTVGAWKEEIDSLLVFAGLFSAVLTAFNVGLYTSLNPDPGVDLTNRILLQISSQLSNLSVSDNTIRSTSFAQSPHLEPTASSIWINAMWFSSLVCSLASATIGILARQWLNYFLSSKASSQPDKSAYIHCLRYDRGLIAWRVPEILSLLPILLLAALVLFLIGLIILLWTLNDIVAGITTALVAALLLFLAVTTLAPAFSVDCPYKSPQALPVFWAVQKFKAWSGAGGLVALMKRFREKFARMWVGIRARLHRLRSQMLGWFRAVPTARPSVDDMLSDVEKAGGVEEPGLRDRYPRRKRRVSFVENPRKAGPFSSWIMQEQAVVTDNKNELVDAELKRWLAVNVLSCADAYLRDDSFLDSVIKPCIMDPATKTSTTIETLRVLVQHNRTQSVRAGTSLAVLAVDLIQKILRNPNSDDVNTFVGYFGDHIIEYAGKDTWERAAVYFARLMCDHSGRYGNASINATPIVQLLTDLALSKWTEGVALSVERQDCEAMDGLHHNVEYLLNHIPNFMPAPGRTGEEIEQALGLSFTTLILTTLVNRNCYERHLRDGVHSLKGRLWKYVTSNEPNEVSDRKFGPKGIRPLLFWAVARITRYCGDEELTDWLKGNVKGNLQADDVERCLTYAKHLP